MAEQGGKPKDASAQAKEAMERARAGARRRGATRKPAGVAARERAARQGGGVDSSPYGNGREPARVGGEIARIIDRMGWKEQIEVASVAARWKEVVGDEIANHCDVVVFDAGVLVLRASSTAWAEQLIVVSGQIRQRLNEEIGRSVVSTIRIERPSTRSWIKGQRTVKGRGPRDTYG